MEILIDTSKIIAETLIIYPSIGDRQTKFEHLLNGHFEALQKQFEVGLRVGGLKEVKADYEKVYKNHKAYFLNKDFSKSNVFGGGSVAEYKAEKEVELRFFQTVVEWFNTHLYENGHLKPKIRFSYCCPDTLKIMQELVENIEVNQTEVTYFEDFFKDHPYTDLKDGNKYRDKTTGDLDFEKLLARIFEFAELFKDEKVRAYFFQKVIEDGLRENHLNDGQTDFQILKNKIEGRLKNSLQKPEDLRPLLPYFYNSETLDLALSAAIEVGLLNISGDWIHVGFKTSALSMFWRASVKAELSKPGATMYKVSKAAGEQFKFDFGQNAIDQKREIANFGTEYKELYKALLDLMRP